MKKNLQDLRSKEIAALEMEVVELTKEKFKLRMQKASGQSAPANRVRQVRKDVARIRTIIREKQLSK